ncbi:MAG: asparagine synthase (glutamine-hydrolyzing) [Humibacillus sp.]|nr:asparagine synthase (glutamine-hydrolyzing) [Humibacillus sp.]MDN5778038.1 asparagine synthase (glutamine-hydrolyzing) [Humibacillus sp.]
MCGIAGYFGLGPDRADDGLLARMGEAQRHRGPDDSGTFVDGPVGMAHQRLSIIDREGGHQPMASSDGRYTLSYNGEVYNYRELRTELEGLSRTFTTMSDTEVVLQAFAEWGAQAFDRFNGMFAIAVWDRDEHTLTLARDHFGIKPLHLCRIAATTPDAADAWLFSSEIKPILASGLYERAPDERTLYRYLRFRVHDDGANTFFDGIERLLPGEMATLSADGMQRSFFSTLSDDLASTRGPAEGYTPALADDFRERLTTAVALRLRSDVPVGTSLSGGLDSSAITVLIDRLLTEHDPSTAAVGHQQSTFSAVFTGYRNDEERYVDDAIDACTNEVNASKVRPSSAEFLDDLSDFVRTQEEPVISAGPYAQYRVMREASRHVTVMLDGQGADEMLAGYLPQLVVHLRDLLRRDRRAGMAEMAASRDILAGLVSQKAHSLRPGRGGAASLLNADFVAAHQGETYAAQGSDLRRRLVHDLFVGSLPSLLRYEDRNAMRFSLEGRVPFLDPGLVKSVFALPDDAIIKNGWNKRVLREATVDLLPPSINRRRKKIGFTAPQRAWFHEQREFVYRVFLSESFANRPYFNRTEVLTAFEQWLSSSGDLDSMAFWRMLNVELWLREFFDRPDTSEAADSAGHERDAVMGAAAGATSPAADRAAPGTPVMSTSANPGKHLDLTLPDGTTVRRHPVRTSKFSADDDLVPETVGWVERFVDTLTQQADDSQGTEGDGHTDLAGSPWYLFVSEKIVATTQQRSHFLWDIPVTPSARRLSRFVTRTPAGIGLGSPFTMQLAIDEAGLPRVLFAAAAGAAGKLVGRRGLFYTAVGDDVRAIDGPTEYSVYPANMSAKLPPKDPAVVAAALSSALRKRLPAPLAATFRGTVVIDANDLGRNVLGTDVPGPAARFEAMFADNPLGQGTETTPLAVVVDDRRPTIVGRPPQPSTTGQPEGR